MNFSRFMRTTFGTVVFVFLFLLTLIQSYWFQNWAIQKITSYLSAELKTTITIEHIGIDLLSNLTLDGFYIEDLNHDTLAYAEKVRLDYDLTWKVIAGKGFTINGLMLENAKVHLNRLKGQAHDNTYFIREYFKSDKPKDPNQKGTPFDLKINYLSFKKVDFRQKDEVNGQEIYAFLDEGGIAFHVMDLLENCIQIRTIELIQPSILVKEKERNPLPEKEKEQNPEEETKVATKEGQSTPLHFTLNRFRLSGGHIVYDNFRASPTRKSPYSLMDFNHLDVHDLNFDFDHFVLLGQEIQGQLTGLSANESCGFILDKFAAKEFKVSPKSIELNGFVIKTPFSEIRDTFQMKYRDFSDFSDFNNKVKFNVKLNDSHLALKDLMPFDRKIAENGFFKANQTEQFKIKGNIRGRVNNLSVDSLLVETKGLSLQGNLALNDVTDADNVFIGFKINKLASDIATIKLFTGRDSLPKGVEKLGRFTFDGFFYGFPYDFSAQGHLRTALGNADMDIVYKPDPKIGNKPSYNGGIDLIGFDLGEFTGNSNFGKVTLEANVNNGTGFTASSAEADLSASIKSFPFKGYTYENLTYSGKLDSRLVDGSFAIQDKNIDFTFKGAIDFRDALPRYDFKAKVNHLSLLPLNLSKEALELSGDVDISLIGNNIDNIVGITRLKNVNAIYKNEKYALDSLNINATIGEQDSRRIELASNILNGYIDGKFDFQRLPKTFKNYLVQHHPVIAKRLKVEPEILAIGNDELDFELNISNTLNFTKLIHKDLDTLKGIHFVGHFDNTKNALILNSLIESIHFQNIRLTDLGYTVNLEQGKGDVDIQLYHTNIQDKYHINLVTILGKLNADSLFFDLNGNRILSDKLDSLSLNGLFSVKPNYFQIGFLNSKFSLFDEQWVVDANNYLRFDNNFIESKNFDIRSGRRQISLKSIDNKGIALGIKGFSFGLLDKLINDKRFTFGGDFEVEARVRNIFKLETIEAVVNADTLFWNKRDWGKFRLDANLKDLKSPVKMALNITKDDEQISAEGFYVLPGTSYTSKGKSYSGNYLRTSMTTSNVPMVWISYLIGSGVSDMKGKVDAQVSLEGPLKKLDLNGKARVRDASFKIDYLNTSYFIKDETATLTTTMIDATGAKIYDETGNFAVIEGGLTHELFDKMRLACSIDSKNKDVLVMNTTKELNNLYYGRGVGKVRVKFSGSFSRTFIDVEKAITGKGTKLNIPVSYAQEAEAVTFIKFKDKSQKTQTPSITKAKTSGLGFTMRLNMTEDADCKIIFNEQTGDVIQGTGKGLINIDVPINENFTMKGDYTFSEGKYLFTIRQQFFSVDKPFTLRPGGTLRWDGDPFKANMDIWADYTASSIPPYELIAPLLTTEAEKQAAKQVTELNLAMNLKGQLLEPEITFDIRLPRLVGQMKSYADTRINQIKQDASELNRQAFAVIVLGGFLPSNQQALNASDVNTALNNTLSGILSTQLANYINSWLRDVIKSNGIISGIDLNISTQAGIDLAALTPNINSVQVRPRINLFDNKLSIDAGFVTSEFNSQTVVNSDIAVEWYITQDRLLRFRVYNRGVQDVQGQRNRTGAGLSWRKEFETWKEFWTKKKKVSS